MPDREKDVGTNAERVERSVPRWLLFVPLLLMLALIAVASFSPDRRMWGVNHLAFYPVTVRIVALAVMALSFVPFVARPACAFALRILDAVVTHNKLRWLVVVVVAVLSVFVFLRYQSATLLLGDGRLVARKFEAAMEEGMGGERPMYRRIAFEDSNAPGAMLLYYGAVRVTENVTGGTPAGVIRIFNCFLGGLFIFFLLLVVLRTSLARSLRIWLVLLVLTSGAMVLFFGYVETYTPMLFLAALYLSSAFICMHRMRLLWLTVTFLCLLACGFVHIQGLLLVPSFVLLLVWFVSGKRREALLRPVTFVLGVLTLNAAYLVWAFTRYGEHFLTLRGTDEMYGVFTPSHVVDVINELLLLLPNLLIVIVMGMVVLWHVRRSRRVADGKAKERRESGWFTRGVEWYFALLVLVPCLVFLLVFKPEIGMARDWDLFSITLIGLLPISTVVLNRFLAMKQATALVSLITAPAAVMSIVLAISWIGINADSAKSTERYVRLFEFDKTNLSYSYEILAEHHYSEGRLGSAVGAMERAVEASHNPRQYVLLAEYYEEYGRVGNAIELLYTVLDKDPQNWPARHNLVVYLNRERRYEELFEAASDGTRYYPERPVFHYYYGMLLIQKGLVREGIAELIECRRLGPPDGVLKEIEGALREFGAK